jgi:hypothetical protein
MDWFKKYFNSIGVEYDLKCILVCKLNNDGLFSFILKKIQGSKKIKLIGSDVNEIDLHP